ncbi:hypothetical protein KQ247_04045 [Ruegeria pomeroyi]|uniref:Porin domain-containing protein n=3 Tax=Ruegeria pomeroyi TaxID=89184 RepID=Q5LP51_RUEPO|nr:hypothetical protein [Ruegeria pomeroyi]AAV96237.1 hypothetical protein SPO2999 [Ruegeria pomeroyi DSS-3]HCE69725.1 hypothetical protein [Ruegeria sp.]NVK96500.1 hypothetical protein [Ruegeria pomeroyi]NVL03273.1 hypothetical protein [Ruegeria pomeroyi]QWV09788.1 hypothetical protein KQ247_04045 [Ruegeria pomeroyi]
MFRHLAMASAVCFSTILSAGSGQAQTWDGRYDIVPGAVSTDAGYAARMFDRQDDVTNKTVLALRARQSGALQDYRLYLGGRFLGSVIHESTNTTGKFPILSRLPPTHTLGTSDTYGVVNEASLNATLTLPWVTAFVQGEYTEVEYPGQDATQLRKYWIALGDLNQSPFYLAIGRKTVNFGNFASYAPFTHTHSSHYFWAQSDDPLIELGYVTERTELALSLLPAHRGLRVVSSPKNNGDYENFAFNASHRFDLRGDMMLKLGAGYLRGTIYDSTIAHHPPGTGINRSWNGAYNVNATLSGSNFDLMAEFTQTEEVWPATGHSVNATTVQGRYRASVLGKPVTYSLAASRGIQGAKGTAWRKMDQVVLGMEMALNPHLTIGAEYMFNDGFVPLIMPTVTAVNGVRSHTVIGGIKLTF